MNLEQFRKMKEFKELGLSRIKTASNLELKEWEIRKYWTMTEDEFIALQEWGSLKKLTTRLKKPTKKGWFF